MEEAEHLHLALKREKRQSVCMCVCLRGYACYFSHPLCLTLIHFRSIVLSV